MPNLTENNINNKTSSDLKEIGLDMGYGCFMSYLPDYEFDDKQQEFFENTFKEIMSNKDTSKVTCFASRPGIGKSTFIKAFMHSCIGDVFLNNHKVPQGLIVVTDSIKRLENLSDSREINKCLMNIYGTKSISNHDNTFSDSVIVLNCETPFSDQLIKQHYKPIVLLSTQRYFMLSQTMRDELFNFSYKKEKYKRDIVIFDECPYFSEVANINSINLTRIESALYEGLSDEVVDKEFAVREFKVFKDRLLDQMDEKEKISEDSNVILYWRDDRYQTITPNDILFFKIIEDNISPLTKQYPAIQRDLFCLKEIAMNGAIFYSVKKKHGTYERSFVVLVDNRKCFYLNGDTKFFVFDATADIDPRYDLDYVEILKGDRYIKSLNLTITNVKVSTSKKALCNGHESSRQVTKAISEQLKGKMKDVADGTNNILIATYNDLTKRFLKDFGNVGYFGNLKGFNDYKDLRYMAHIGLNRYPSLAYFYIYCGCHREVYEKISDMTEKESIKFFDSISKNHNKEYEDVITQVMIRSMAADFEQNIFRLAIRNYDNTDHVHVWSYYNIGISPYKEFASLLEKRYLSCGVRFEYEDTPMELRKQKTENKKPPKGKNKTNAQIILEWVDSQENGRVFKLKELLNATGLTNESFKSAKKDNKTIKEMFKKMQTDKRGYYKVLKLG